MSLRIHLDANVILRSLRNDDAQQSPAAAKLFQNGSSGKAALFVSSAILPLKICRTSRLEQCGFKYFAIRNLMRIYIKFAIFYLYIKNDINCEYIELDIIDNYIEIDILVITSEWIRMISR